MFKAIRVFEYREPVTEEYQVPSIDVVSDVSVGSIIYPPATPIIVGCSPTGLTWESVPGATGYLVENMVSGGLWTALASVSVPTPVQIVWDGYEWLIQSFTGGNWITEYQSLDDVPIANYTPDQVSTWEIGLGSGTTPLPIVSPSDPVSEGGMLVASAGTPVVNTYYALVGNRNGYNYHVGPSEVEYNFSPSASVLYRVRAVNGAGNGPASNAVISEALTAPSIAFVSSRSSFNGLIAKSIQPSNPTAWESSGFLGIYTPKTQAQISANLATSSYGPSASAGTNWSILVAPACNWFYLRYQVGSIWSPWSLPCIYP